MQGKNLLGLTVGALGVVYGDIGTSPLYAMRECFNGIHAVMPTPANVLGVLSLIFWSLMIVVSCKYVGFIMRADNRGEGGILALMALLLHQLSNPRKHWWLMVTGLFGAALFYGDAMITPAISVLGAVEGLKVAAPFLEQYVIPATLCILIPLFMFQSKGTATVSGLFGPVMCVWFGSLALLGIPHILQQPQVLQAFNPLYGVNFFLINRWQGFVVLGAVFLVVTGSEALYADMGHFGKRPIRLAWFGLVLPALLLNYFGQGALLIRTPAAAENPFYLLAPPWGLYPLLVLATAATIIASQAVISGTFSLTQQSVQLGYWPHLEITHTSAQQIGQIYVPQVNWGLFIAVIGLVLGFQSSSSLAAAYGVAVATTMVITTLLTLVAMRKVWRWGWIISCLVIGLFLIVDLALFSANALKVPHGGWFPLVIALAVFTPMSTWKRGRELLAKRLQPVALPLYEFLSSVARDPPLRVPGTAVFLTGNPIAVPHALLHNLKHNKVLHERVVFLTVLTKDIPRVPKAKRVEVTPLGNNFYRVTACYGFMEVPNIPKVLKQCNRFGLQFNMMETSFFLGRKTLIPTKVPGMALWREKLFVRMARNASSITDFFRIPSNRVVELGTQVEL